VAMAFGPYLSTIDPSLPLSAARLVPPLPA
jgi:hypothetical protein